MTTVIFEKSADGRYISFTSFGHAGFAKKHLFFTEPDILCSAISSLTFHTLNGLSELAREEIAVSQNEETGFIRCMFPEKMQEKSLFLVDCFLQSLQELSKEYGEDHLKIEIKEG